jgi:hypothetical protein
MIDSVQAMVVSLVKALVTHPDEVVVKPIEGDNTVVFEVQVHPEDTGKVIGKKGRTINALRTIVRSSAFKGDKKIMMELV